MLAACTTQYEAKTHNKNLGYVKYEEQRANYRTVFAFVLSWHFALNNKHFVLRGLVWSRRNELVSLATPKCWPRSAVVAPRGWVDTRWCWWQKDNSLSSVQLGLIGWKFNISGLKTKHWGYIIHDLFAMLKGLLRNWSIALSSMAHFGNVVECLFITHWSKVIQKKAFDKLLWMWVFVRRACSPKNDAPNDTPHKERKHVHDSSCNTYVLSFSTFHRYRTWLTAILMEICRSHLPATQSIPWVIPVPPLQENLCFTCKVLLPASQTLSWFPMKLIWPFETLQEHS